MQLRHVSFFSCITKDPLYPKQSQDSVRGDNENNMAANTKQSEDYMLNVVLGFSLAQQQTDKRLNLNNL